MQKYLSTLVALLIFCNVNAQFKDGIKGFTVSGIKGIKKSMANIIAMDKLKPMPGKIKLKPELERPRPTHQYPGAEAINRSGSMVSGDNVKVTATSAPTQAVHSNFLAIWGSYAAVSNKESPYTPPDNCGDVGTTQVVATANCRMKVFTKPTITGAASLTPTGSSTTTLPEVLNVNLNNFFANSALGITGVSDPHVRFDRLSGRWYVVAIEINHYTNNYACIAVSDGPTITSSSSFQFYYFNVSGTGGSAVDFFDYPTLGIDKNSLYIGGNMFGNRQFFSGVSMWVINKANLNAGSLTVTGFHQSATGTDMYTPQGVHNDDPNASYGYFVGASQYYWSKLVIRRVSYPGGIPVLSGDLNLATLQMYAPRTAPTLGGVAVDGGDGRPYAAMIKKNKINGTANLWVAQGTRVNLQGIGSSSGDRNGALWFEIGNLSTTPVILQSAILYDDINPTASALYFTYPTIAVSGQGHNVMGFTSTGPTKYAQAAVAGRYRGDPAGNFQSPVDFTTSTSTYNPGANRWGDYTQTVVDPSDDMTMWTFSEYTSTTNAWGVRAAQLKAPPPSTPVLVSVPACGATSTITINGTSVNNSEFFDPGDDVNGPGFNRLNVSVTGPGSITVSKVVFVNPSEVKADITVPENVAGGAYTLTITNPDGQTSSTTFNLNCTSPCGDPVNQGASAITNTSATLSWSSVGGATGYDVDYKLSTSSTWTNAATGTPFSSVNISGLVAGSNYNWRVRAGCGEGIYGNYTASQFNTTEPCNPPSGLTSSVTSNSATVGWAAVSNATNYDVEYKLTSASLWTTAATATSSTSVNIPGLTAATSYHWRVKANCNSGSSNYATATFVTLSATCPDQSEPNNTIATAAAIPIATDFRALIATSKDLDYYAFSNTEEKKKVKITLTTLPTDYEMKLYGKNNNMIGHSTNSGVKDEIIVYNATTVMPFKLYVYGKSGRFNSTLCYTLNVQLGVTNFSKNDASVDNEDKEITEEGQDMIQTIRDGLKIYPVPAKNEVTVSFDAYASGYAEISIITQLGQQVLYRKVKVNDGINFNTIDVSKLRAGIYTIKVNNGREIRTKKMIVSR